MRAQIEVIKVMNITKYINLSSIWVLQLTQSANYVLEGNSGLQQIQVSGKPRLSLAAHRHYHQRHHRFALFICLSAWEIVQMPLWHLPLCPLHSPPAVPFCSADPFLVRPAPERALLCDFWDCCCCCCCCCLCYFRQPHSALFHLNFRHAAFLFIDPKSR